MVLFVGMIAYMIYFQAVKSEDILTSPYNQRQAAYSDTITRGSILGITGAPLAYTATDENGAEIRVYPYGRLFAQTVGYTDFGSSGLENVLGSRLLDSHADLITQMENGFNDAKSPGDNVVTYLDHYLQQTAYDALGGRKGAVVVLDADTANIMACESQTDFDPNTIAADWDYLNAEEAGSPFLNRAFQGLYEPGSTFKILTALAFIREHPDNWQDFRFSCQGEYTAGTYTIHCSEGKVHGEEDLYSAFANSCNCAFSYIATNLLSQRSLYSIASDMGFNDDLGLELPSSEPVFTLERLTQDGLSMQTAIGQGDTLASPIQMAMIAQAVYNYGIMLKPSFLVGTVTSEGDLVERYHPEYLGRVMSTGESSALKRLMRGVVESGTGTYLADLPYNICGKTGTAEYDNENGYYHSWFVGFSNTGENDIVVAVLFEEALPGEAPALAAARSIFVNYFNR